MKLQSRPRGGVENLGPAPVVILCRPQMGENVGSAARAMLNFGLTELRLVNPAFGWPNAKAVASSSGAHAILNMMTVHDTLEEAVGDLHHLYATTARERGMSKPVQGAREATISARALIDDGRRVGILFGPERTGLVNEELTLADGIISVPLNPAFPSLNLSQAVLLCSYEWHMSGLAEGEGYRPAAMDADVPATKGDLARLLDHLIGELDKTGYFRSDDRRISLSQTIRVMFERRQMTQSEVHLLRGIIKDLVNGRRVVNRG
ncbi:MAG: RNA methyltransferase [Geminicoccaceae bacterium]|nr:RNA methyltransferase [Geminicoccaceae bacterium]MCB9943072.1 RNA methyltransferase [Geminicoccaceae bacterium]